MATTSTVSEVAEGKKALLAFSLSTNPSDRPILNRVGVAEIALAAPTPTPSRPRGRRSSTRRSAVSQHRSPSYQPDRPGLAAPGALFPLPAVSIPPNRFIARRVLCAETSGESGQTS